MPVCPSACLSVFFCCIQSTDRNVRDILMNFGTLMCFNSSTNTIENSSGWTTSLTTYLIWNDLWLTLKWCRVFNGDQWPFSVLILNQCILTFLTSCSMSDIRYTKAIHKEILPKIHLLLLHLLLFDSSRLQKLIHKSISFLTEWPIKYISVLHGRCKNRKRKSCLPNVKYLLASQA